MSEIEGYVLVHSVDEKAFNAMVNEFKQGSAIELDDFSYDVNSARVDNGILDLYFYTSEYADTEKLSHYFLEKYSPNILISSFDKNAFIDLEKVDHKKAFTALSNLSSQLAFYLNIEHGNYEDAYKIISEGNVSLTDISFGVPNLERCFFGDHVFLMEYAVDRGYHDHYCKSSALFPFLEDGVHVLHRLVSTGNLVLIEKALRLGADVNGVNGDEQTLLHLIGAYALSDELDFNVLDLINLLAAYGANFNAKDYDGITPILYLYSEFEDSLEENKTLLIDIIEMFIKHGASVDVFDSSGVGLLSYYSEVDEVTSILLQVSPQLKPLNEDFNIDSYIMERAYLNENDLPHDYHEYFCKCIELGFIDFLLDEEQISIVKSLSCKQLEIILIYVTSSPYVVQILQGFKSNNLPIVVEQNIEEAAEEIQYIEEMFDYQNNKELVSFYNQMKKQTYKKLVVNYSASSYLLNSYNIVDES